MRRGVIAVLLASPLLERTKKVTRLLTYLGFVFFVVALLAARAAYSDVEKAALSMGDELGRLGDVGARQTVRLNGEEMFVASSTEDADLPAVLDRFEAYCKGQSAGVAEGFEGLPADVKRELGGEGRRAAAGILRREEGERGVVACLVRRPGQGEGTAESITARLDTFADTGDLSTFGDLRYLFAKRTKNGRTHVVLAWTDGSFKVGALVPPTDADAAGDDPFVAPRPPGARRVFSAGVQGAPYGVYLFDAKAPASDVMAAYDAALLDAGYALVAKDPDDPNARAYTHPRGDLWVTVTDGDGASVVSAVEITARR
ncbi:MAG TPA: hypothetical protein VL400_20045 [Polyangiaceae bacterium]|nr:hypothetical protein [Polyangiaceae bacterium]